MLEFYTAAKWCEMGIMYLDLYERTDDRIRCELKSFDSKSSAFFNYIIFS